MGAERASADRVYEAARSNAVAARHRLAETAARMLDDAGRPHDSRWWFTNSYVRTTDGAVTEADAGSFADPVFIFRLITYFEKLYLDNLTAADSGRAIEPHWQEAFDAAARADARRLRARGAPDEAPKRSALLGVASSVVAASRAHVRFDLPRAMAWVHQTPLEGTPDGEFPEHIGDFMAMAAVFERATVAANVDVARQTRLPFHLVPRRLQDWGMRSLFRADLIHERAFAWDCAQELVETEGAGDNPYDEPEPGRLEGDVTRSPSLRCFAGLDPGLRPTMGSARRAPVDAAARAGVVLTPLDTVERIRALQGLCHGYTGPGDERAIMTMLRAAAGAGDLVPTVNGVGAWELAINLQGRERLALRTLLRTDYYPHIQPTIAATLLRRALLFVELPWEEDVIADLLCDRSDAISLVEAVGDDDQTGWERVQRNLGGRSLSRVLVAHPELGHLP